ncbi:hypothetical protein GQ54DRAFT_171817 [Martensiomyces pterosporus]|nr:hypothetical protein GQ54DRAFT_171817 [Martensiomyces pterosporus]
MQTLANALSSHRIGQESLFFFAVRGLLAAHSRPDSMLPVQSVTARCPVTGSGCTPFPLHFSDACCSLQGSRQRGLSLLVLGDKILLLVAAVYIQRS